MLNEYMNISYSDIKEGISYRRDNGRDKYDLLYNLPVLFITGPMVERLKHHDKDYKAVLTSGVDEFEKILGGRERFILELLNYKMVSMSIDNDSTMLGNDITEYGVRRNRDELKDSIFYELSLLLNKQSIEDEYIIEYDSNYIYIIMNTNSFVSFGEMYHTLSKELCAKMLELGIDESFVYNSAYFEALEKNHMTNKLISR